MTSTTGLFVKNCISSRLFRELLTFCGRARRAGAAAWNLIRPATVLVERAQAPVEDLMRRSDIPVVLGYLLLFLPVVLWAAAH
jgi:hypothetical protein